MEALLDQCLTSLILPDKGHREMLDVIVVIDGATDRSSEIAHRYADQYPEMFSVIDKENGNYGSCINAALPKVRGKYVRILDADDRYFTENMVAFITLLNQLNVDLVLTDYLTVNAVGNIVEDGVVNASANKILELKDISFGDFIPMHNVTYRSSIFKDIDYHQTEGISYTDLEWVFHPMIKVKSVYYYPHKIYRYFEGREGQTVDTKVILNRLTHMEKGLWNQLAVYNTVSEENAAFCYMKEVILYRTKLLYIWGLDKKAVFDLKDFDSKVHDYPWLYEAAKTFTIPVGLLNMQMPIVKMWRVFKTRRALLLFPIYLLYVIISKIKSFL